MRFVIASDRIAVLRTHKAKQAEERLFLGEAYKDLNLVFARPDGSPVTPWNFGASFKDLVARARVKPVTLHDLRDTHASLLAKAGVPIDVISHRPGHICIGITVDSVPDGLPGPRRRCCGRLRADRGVEKKPM